MNDQRKRNQKLFIIVCTISFIPFALAWILLQNPHWLSGTTTNTGQLISPPVITERDELIGFDPFSIDNMDELKGRWVMMNFIPGNTCEAVCLEAMHKTRQLRLMMNKDLTRIRRVVLVMKQVDSAQAQHWWQDDTRLLRARPSPAMAAKIRQIRNGSIPEGLLIIMDPLGNLMMQYEPGFDPYDVQKDLKKLLRISQIG